HHPDQTLHRRDHPAGPPSRATHRRAHLPGTARLRAALVTTTPTPPSHRPLAPPQHPTVRRNRTRGTNHNRMEITPSSPIQRTPIALRGGAATHRKTATVVLAGVRVRAGADRLITSGHERTVIHDGAVGCASRTVDAETGRSLTSSTGRS